MTEKDALIKLRACQKTDDTEAAHCEADEVLCDLLTALGYAKVVDAYKKVSKWYA